MEKRWQAVEFQVVILAIDGGDRLDPLNDMIPRALLPIGTKPLLYYQLEHLMKSSFKGIRTYPQPFLS